MSEPEPQTPPVGEEIHLPGESALPIVMALGITMAVIGLTIGPAYVVSYFGVAIFLVTLVMWIRDTRRDISELPEEHHHH